MGERGPLRAPVAAPGGRESFLTPEGPEVLRLSLGRGWGTGAGSRGCWLRKWGWVQASVGRGSAGRPPPSLPWPPAQA